MEEKINVVGILRDKPKGTKLYSSACGKCKLEEVYDKSFKISFYNSKFGFMNGGEGYLDKNGKLYDDGECFGHRWYKHQEYLFTLRYNNFLEIYGVSFNDGKNDTVMIKSVDELQHILYGLQLDSNLKI